MGSTDNGPLVDWQWIGRDRFERLIEALIAWQHPLGTRVYPVDGRGGDGGIDVLAIEPSDDKIVVYQDPPGGRVVVYQLKYFPEGFDGKEAGRRNQIKRSLEQAIKHVPQMDKWVLVAPCTASRSGWAFLKGLCDQNPASPSFTAASLTDPHGLQVIKTLQRR